MEYRKDNRLINGAAFIMGVAAGVLTLMLLFPGSTAFGYSAQVKQKCKPDYFRHCSHTPPYSNEMRECMGNVGPQLSKSCLSALKASGEVSKWQKARN